MYNNMEAQIHHLEKEAYSAVLRAFKAQSDAITWEKEGLITELRKELRVSDDEHRELLTRVNGDEIIQQIREWRATGEHQAAPFRASQPMHDVLPSPTVSASRKRQKPSQSVQSFSGLSASKSMRYPSFGSGANRHFTNYGSSGPVMEKEPTEPTAGNPLIGRKVWTRWPDDNHFYEAVISDYNPSEGRHALVYDEHTRNETWEWVNLGEIPADDIRWEGEDPGISRHVNQGGPDLGMSGYTGRGGLVFSSGRWRGSMKSRREFSAAQNGFAKEVADEIELRNTETLVQEVERLFGLTHPDPHELEKAKRMLKEHEQALVNAITRLAEASDDEIDGEQEVLHVQQPMEHV